MSRFFRFVLAIMIIAFASRPSAAAENAAPFALFSHTLQTLSPDELAKAQSMTTIGKLSDDKQSLTFDASAIRLVVTTGPADDMLSYRIQGVRNPTLVVPKGATLRILFVNTDEDMPHDLRFGAVMPPFPLVSDATNSVGSAKLQPLTNGQYAADEVSFQTTSIGSFTYFCSVRGHAKSGMFGTIAVGVAAPDSSTRSAGTMAGMDMGGMKMSG